MNLFFFGGSFDPPHFGHLKIAEYSLKMCDRFLFIPARRSPHKINAPIASSKHRKRMLEILLKDLSGVDIIDFELKNNPPSYTWTTIQFLIQTFNPNKMTMVLGADQLSQMDKWYKIEKIKQTVEILCFERNKQSTQSRMHEDSIKVISDFVVPVSSSEIRQKFHKLSNTDLHQMLPESVLNYIIEQKLYG
tara:strand:+ start:680 stop:1252 length:573 start_codon:yes stop_codon:yes gene_type:complete